MRVIPSLSAAALAMTLALTTTPAGAVKPERGCPPSFTFITAEELLEEFPMPIEEFEVLFSFFDKNGDGLLCTKTTPGLFNTIDNTANV